MHYEVIILGVVPSCVIYIMLCVYYVYTRLSQTTNFCFCYRTGEYSLCFVHLKVITPFSFTTIDLLFSYLIPKIEFMNNNVVRFLGMLICALINDSLYLFMILFFYQCVHLQLTIDCIASSTAIVIKL